MKVSRKLIRASSLVATAALVSLVASQPVIAERSSALVAQSAQVAPRPTPTAALPSGLAIRPISSIASIKSYKTAVSMKLDGQSSGRVAKGDFNAEARTELANKRQSIGVSGSLVPVLLGRYLQGLPISGLTLYLMDGKPYIVAQALILRVCAVSGAQIAGLDQLSSGLSADSGHSTAEPVQ